MRYSYLAYLYQLYLRFHYFIIRYLLKHYYHFFVNCLSYFFTKPTSVGAFFSFIVSFIINGVIIIVIFMVINLNFSQLMFFVIFGILKVHILFTEATFQLAIISKVALLPFFFAFLVLFVSLLLPIIALLPLILPLYALLG